MTSYYGPFTIVLWSVHNRVIRLTRGNVPRYEWPMPLRLGFAARTCAAFHVLRTGDYQPATDYLRGVRDGLDEGLAMAWGEFQRCFPGIGPAPDAPAKHSVSPFHEP